MNWTKEVPNKPCVFLCRSKYKGRWSYSIFRIEWVYCDEGSYLGWLTEDGEEWDDLAELVADEFLIAEETLEIDEIKKQ